MFNKIKFWYETGLWNIDRVRLAVPKMITPEQYKEITGEDYTV